MFYNSRFERINLHNYRVLFNAISGDKIKKPKRNDKKVTELIKIPCI